MKTQPLSFDLIRLDRDTQCRLTINEDTVEDYAEVIAATKPGEWPFPPLDVFHDGSEYFMSSGFHRLLGAQRADRTSAPCIVHQGTAKDARIFGMTANDKHGLRMTRAERRANAQWLLDHGLPRKDIAVKAGVSIRTVDNIISDRKPKLQIAVSPPKKSGKKVSNPPVSSNGKPADYGKCPNCAGTKWDDDNEGVSCAKCHHPHGEPAGDVDDEHLKIQRSKTVKTAEALMRAFDDLYVMRARSEHGSSIACCKQLIQVARAWK